MKLRSILTKASLALMITSSVILGGSKAIALNLPGQVLGGNSNYQIANVTKGTGYANTQTADACDVVEYRLSLYNPGPGSLSDVKVEASINSVTPYTQYVSTATAFTPGGQTPQVNFQATLNMTSSVTQKYVAGSTELLDNNGNVIKSSANGALADTITDGAGGIDLGGLGESVQEYVQFKAQLSCPTPQTPVYTCDSLGLTAEDNRTVKISSFNTTAQNGATFTSADLTWGDNSAKVNTANVVGQTHQYGQNGTYTITAVAHFSVNGQDQTSTSQACTQQVVFSSTTPPKVTPPPATTVSTPPSQLVNTGAGNVAELFAVATVAGTVGYRYFLSRRLSRQ